MNNPRQPTRGRLSPKPDTLATRMARWLLRYYLLILGVAAIATVYSFQLATSLKLDTNLAALMPEGVASVDNLERVMEKTGSFSNAMVVVDSPDPDAALAFVKALRAKVLELPWVSSAEYSEDTSVFERNKLLYMETADLEEIQRRIDNRLEYERTHPQVDFKGTEVKIKVRGAKEQSEPPPLNFDDIEAKYQKDEGDKTSAKSKLFRSKDKQVTILLVWPRGETTDIAFSRHLIKDLEKTVAELDPDRFHPYMQVDVGGRIRNRVAQFEAAMNDLASSGLWSVSAILLLLIFYYRRLFSVFYIGLPLVVGIIWTFGLTAIVLGSLNLVTIFLVIVLFGLGIDFGIHNLARYDEVRRCGGSVEEALTTILRRTGVASLMAGVTTIAGFYSLMITEFRAFYEFGFIAGTGVALTFLSMYLVFPALMLVAERLGLYRVGAPQVDVCNVTREGYPRPRVILFAVLAVFGLSLYFAKDVRFEDDFSKLDAKIPELRPIKDRVNKVFSLRTDRAILFVPTIEDVKKVVAAVEEKMTTDETPTIERVRSIYTVVPGVEEQKHRLEIIREIKSDVDPLREHMSKEQREQLADIIDYLDVTGIDSGDLPPALRRVYTGLPGSGGYLVYIYNKYGLSQAERAHAFAEDIRNIEVDGKVYHPATEALIFVDMRNLMQHDAAVALIAVTTVIALVLVVAFRSLTKALIILFPVVLGLGLMLGLMGRLDIKLSIFNMVVLPAVVGIGVDNAIHIYHRYAEEGVRSLRHVVRTTGWAAAITTLTSMFGFAGMLSATNGGLQSLGLLACVGLGTCLFSSVTALPALLQWLESRRPGPRPEAVEPAPAHQPVQRTAKVA